MSVCSAKACWTSPAVNRAARPADGRRRLFSRALLAEAVRARGDEYRGSGVYGGAGASSFTRCWPSKPSPKSTRRSVLVDVQNTLVINAILRWGTEDVKRRYAAASRRVECRRLRPLRGGLGQRCVRADHTSHAGRRRLPAARGRKLWITNAHEADVFIVFATVDPAAGYRGITAFLIERGTPGSRSARRKTSWASAPAAPVSSSSTSAGPAATRCSATSGKGYKVAIETLNEGRIGIGAQMLGLARVRSITPSAM